MTEIVRKPLFWLTLQLAVTFAVLAWSGGLEYTRVPDTPSYLNVADAESWTEALSHNRTLGYPLFLPALGFVLKWLHSERNWKQLAQWTAIAGLVTFLPFLAFCSLRWATVRHFGVVSFGGPNQAGMAASFIGSQVVRQLPHEHQGLARNMMKMRRKRGWEAMTRRSAIIDYFVQYSDNIWRVAIPAAQKEHKRISALPEDHPDRLDGMERPARVVQNEMLSQASRAIVRLRPGLYFKWVTSAMVHGLKQLLNYLWIVAPALLILFSTPIFLLAIRAPGASISPPRVK